MSDNYANHFWRLNDKTKVKENSIYYDAVYDTLLSADKTARILDIGCGGGHCLAYLRRKGYINMVGIDQSPELVQFVIQEIWPQTIQTEALTYLQQHLGEFDMLIANDFIEHLPKQIIGEFLQLCRTALRPGGKLLIKTPNMSNPLASRHRYVDFTHEVGFTETSLHQVCANAGFTKVIIYPEFPTRPESFSYHLLRWFYRLLNEESLQILSTNLIAECYK